MGINFMAGHPARVFSELAAPMYVSLLHARFGSALPLGNPDEEAFVLSDEMGWSWWQQLQARALAELGPERTRQIRATDAWQAVYVDADFERELLAVPGVPPRDPDAPWQHGASAPASWFGRMLERLGLRRAAAVPAETQRVLDTMMDSLATRRGERGRLQVGNLGRLRDELAALLQQLGCAATDEAVERLRRPYVDDDARVDDDPDIQCLCHAWLTASHALRAGTPLWLVK